MYVRASMGIYAMVHRGRGGRVGSIAPFSSRYKYALAELSRIVQSVCRRCFASYRQDYVMPRGLQGLLYQVGGFQHQFLAAGYVQDLQ